MVALRNRPKSGLAAPFGLCVLAALLVPREIGPQDLAVLIAKEPAMGTARSYDHMIGAPLGTVYAATFSFPKPIKMVMPVSLGSDTSDVEATGSLREQIFAELALGPSALPVVDRRLKGDRLPVPLAPPQVEAQEPGADPVEPPAQAPAEVATAVLPATAPPEITAPPATTPEPATFTLASAVP